MNNLWHCFSKIESQTKMVKFEFVTEAQYFYKLHYLHIYKFSKKTHFKMFVLSIILISVQFQSHFANYPVHVWEWYTDRIFKAAILCMAAFSNYRVCVSVYLCICVSICVSVSDAWPKLRNQWIRVLEHSRTFYRNILKSFFSD